MPYVLPIEQKKFDQIQATKNVIFKTEDKSWQSTFPVLAKEVKEYNEQIKASAKKNWTTYLF